MIEIEIMYKGGIFKRQVLSKIDRLPKNNVLFITAWITDPEKKGGLKKLTTKSGFDHYSVCYKNQSGYDWVLLYGWDDDDFTWRNEINKRQDVDAPLGCLHAVFRGVGVSERDWKKAMKTYDSKKY